MRRSLLASLGATAVLFVAACSTDQPSEPPLAPDKPSLAPNVQCKQSLANDIGSQQDQLFSETDEAVLTGLFDTIKDECPMSTPSATLLAYLQKVVDFRGTVDVARAQDLVGLWDDVTRYATGTAIGLSHTVLLPGTVVPNAPGIRGGGAAVLNPVAGPLSMYTFDGQAGIQILSNQTPAGPHLWTMDPTGCPTTTLRPATSNCYEVKAYPTEVAWSPEPSIGMCMAHNDHDAAITHAETGFGTEILPPGPTFPWDLSVTCAQTHTFLDTWLGRKGGPLGRMLARGLDAVSPQLLHAYDSGISGRFRVTSPFGGGLRVIFEELFTDNALGNFPNQTDPDVGDNASSWFVNAPSPGYIQVQDGSVLAPNGGLPGNVIVLNQAGGACKKSCPTFSLLGTRVNPTPADDIGAYEVTWKSLQNKPNIKEAPFVLLSASGQEIARLSYVSQSNQNRILYNGANTQVVWTQNVAQSFKVIVRLDDDDASNNDYTTDLYINDALVLSNVPFKTQNQTTFSTIGYQLTGVDAGIMAADNFLVKRLFDKP